MTVNHKGVKGLIKAIEHFADLGWYCFPAFDDHSPVDLVVMDPEGKAFRLQVKYRELNKQELKENRERYELNLNTMVNSKWTPINRNLIDGWAVYCKHHNLIKIIPISAASGIKTGMLIAIDKDYGSL